MAICTRSAVTRHDRRKTPRLKTETPRDFENRGVSHKYTTTFLRPSRRRQSVKFQQNPTGKRLNLYGVVAAIADDDTAKMRNASCTIPALQ